MATTIINRAELLIRQHKYEEAQKVLADLLSHNPNDVHVLALMTEVNIHQKSFKEAERLINSAIGIDPGMDYLFFIKAKVMLNLEKYDDAELCLEQAVALHPGDGDYYALWSSVKLARKQFQKALDLANKSLELDGENLLGLNIRSTALLKLNRKEESLLTIEGALREDPNNSYTHANYGWHLLEKGNSAKALEHFREALRHDPNYSYAQIGMAEALKGRFFIYRMFLKYSFWMSKLTAKYQWGFIIGFYLAFRGIRMVSNQYEGLQPYLNPLLIILAVIAFSTWVLNPISNLFLRLNRYGKYLLNKNEQMSSNFVGLSALLFVVGLGTYFINGRDVWLILAIFGFAMMVPFGSMFEPTKYKYSLVVYTFILFLVGLVAVYTAFVDNARVFNGASIVFLAGFFIFQWVANFLIIKQSNI